MTTSEASPGGPRITLDVKLDGHEITVTCPGTHNGWPRTTMREDPRRHTKHHGSNSKSHPRSTQTSPGTAPAAPLFIMGVKLDERQTTNFSMRTDADRAVAKLVLSSFTRYQAWKVPEMTPPIHEKTTPERSQRRIMHSRTDPEGPGVKFQKRPRNSEKTPPWRRQCPYYQRENARGVQIKRIRKKIFRAATQKKKKKKTQAAPKHFIQKRVEI